MIVNKINIDKITKTFELTCPLLKQNLVHQIFIVGSVSKGTAKEDSDIDVILYNQNFEHNLECLDTNIKYTDKFLIKLVDKLNECIDETVHKIEYKHKIRNDFYYQKYKHELFHFMITNEKDYIIKYDKEYIEITEELCNEVYEYKNNK